MLQEVIWEKDTTAPVESNQYNESVNSSCSIYSYNLTTDEPANISIIWYQYFNNGSYMEDINSTNSVGTDFNKTPAVNMTSMVSNRRYAYNVTVCDEQANCGTESYTFRFPFALCDGWSHYGILNATTNSSTLADVLEADYVAWWNITDFTFETFTRASPSLGGSANLTRGDAVLVYRTIDTTWSWEYRINMLRIQLLLIQNLGLMYP